MLNHSAIPPRRNPNGLWGLTGETLTDGLGVGAEMERNLLGVKACVQSWRMGRSWNGKESEVGNRLAQNGKWDVRACRGEGEWCKAEQK